MYLFNYISVTNNFESVAVVLDTYIHFVVFCRQALKTKFKVLFKHCFYSCFFPAFKEMLQAPDSSPRARVRKTVEIARLQMDPRARPDVPLPPPLPPSPLKPQPTPTPKKAGSSTLLGPRRRLINILKMNILPKNTITSVHFFF